MAVNRRRGEVALDLAGRSYRLCLTLGALAELEDALGTDSLAGLAERFCAGRPAARDLIALLAASLRGGGYALSDAEVAALPIAEPGGVAGLAESLADLLALTFGAGEVAPENPRMPPSPPTLP